jgi:hypothetical protein
MQAITQNGTIQNGWGESSPRAFVRQVSNVPFQLEQEENRPMAEPQPDNPPANPAGITYNYSMERARALYALREKPPDMTTHEWAIVSDEGFRKYVASQLGIPYAARQSL